MELALGAPLLIRARHGITPTQAGRTLLQHARTMLEQAERVRQQLPLLAIHADVLEACVRHGEAELDNSAVIKEIRRRTRP